MPASTSCCGWKMPPLAIFCSLFLAFQALPLMAAESDLAELEPIQVTATRVALPVQLVPAFVTVVTGEELEAIGARDLRMAMSLVAGVDIAPGGDGGPASSVPGMWGLREFDAFLLVVDGVPWGGAFNPELASIILSDVDRIEVLRGAAPVIYGATSFVGVIHIIHRAAGEAERSVRGSYGSYDTYTFTGSVNLPQSENYRHSLAFEGENRGFSDPRAKIGRGHLLYRGGFDTEAGGLDFDLNALWLRQDPTSPHLREGPVLAPDLPLDANYNPSDARLDQDFYQFSATYLRPLGDLDWSTTLSVTDVENDNVRGFLDEEYVDDGHTPNAAGYTQDRDTTGVYFDSHVAHEASPTLQAIIGVDYLYGKAKQTTENFDYYVPADGSFAPASGDQAIEETFELSDRRNFYGVYLQLTGQITDTVGYLAGVRINHTVEDRQASEFEGEEADEEDLDEEDSDRQQRTRPGGMVGLSWKMWQREHDYVTGYANYRNTYKPAAIDFGPEAEGEILQPETAYSFDVGLKGMVFAGQFEFDLSWFDQHIDNLVVTQSIDGRPGLTNAGEEHFKGIEFEGRYHFSANLLLAGNYAWHDARFGDYEQLFGNNLTQLKGKHLEMAPSHLAALGLVYHPDLGPHGSILWNYVGKRYLTKRNTAEAESYTTWDANVGWRFEHWDLTVAGYNLSDERPPVSESELGESQYYRLPARSIEAFATVYF